MKVVILAGGLGSRLSEETHLKPKPLVEIGGKPILWHIMKTYSHYGLNDFIICLGYKGYLIKEYFANYYMHNSDLTLDLNSNNIEYKNSKSEKWKVSLIDTGENTITGGRLKRIKKYLDDEDFCFTYGDCLADINILKLIEFHKSQKTLATVTAIQPASRFGVMTVDSNNLVREFNEKPQKNNAIINGGFFILSPKVLDFIEGDNTVWEKEPIEKLTKINELSAYMHESFWHPMDTISEKNNLEKLWKSGNAPWKQWN